ncbi:hypothetical protein ORM30_24015 [Bacillus cereus]|nr:hypothetical protein [Bacillus cereus]MDA2127185.1 hypothetical protein [Bacillus cereus]MDA2149929.1 hypothetical protein [Bacillus cereus]MDZ4443492.1 hypothetical protein [Bacillus cereus]MEB9164094.1 hypothetical protein [Bacillus cereus]
MSLNCRVNFEKIKPLTPYTAIIYGNSAQFGSDSDFELEYSGADLIKKKGYIPDIVMPILKEDLNEVLGYGPFDNKKLRQKFKSTKSITYTIKGDTAYRYDN